MKFLLIAFFQLFFATSFCQLLRINGAIVDENGNSIPRVMIHDKNEILKTWTDAEGSFSLITHQNDTLYFTHLGYTKFLYVARASGLIGIVLKQEPCVVKYTSADYISFSGFSSFNGRLIKEELTGEIIPEIKDSNNLYTSSDYILAVQIAPMLKGKINDLLDGIDSEKINSDGIIKLKFLVTKTGKIEQIVSVKSYLPEVDRQVIQNLLTKFKVLMAEERGRKVDAYCELEIELQNENGHVAVDVCKHA